MKVCEIDTSQMHNYNIEEESPEKKSSKDRLPIVRFVAKISYPDFQ